MGQKASQKYIINYIILINILFWLVVNKIVFFILNPGVKLRVNLSLFGSWKCSLSCLE